MAEQQDTKFDLVSDSGVYCLPFQRNKSHDNEADGVEEDDRERARVYYDDQSVLITHYRVLERRRSTLSCSSNCLLSTKIDDEKNPSLDVRQPESTQHSPVTCYSFSLERRDSTDSSVSNSPVSVRSNTGGR